MRVRFAPSPTGPLHIGGARTALFNLLLARREGGTLILRLDDTDRERSEKRFEDEIVWSLDWLGIPVDEGFSISETGPYGSYRQSERLDRHLALAESLKASGAAYLDAENCLRIKYPDNDIIVHDEICGDCVFSPQALGPDPVILRSDGTPTYHLASVSDDIDMKITHIVRGQDHLTNTAKHIVIFNAAGAPVPVFAHLPLILGPDGSKLSKRNSKGFTTVRDFHDAGYLPEALMNFLCLLGWSHPEGTEVFDVSEVSSHFSTERVNTTGAKFELAKLDWFNGQYLRSYSAEKRAAVTLEWTGEWRAEVERKGSSYWQHAMTVLASDFSILTQVEKLCRLLLSEEVLVDDEAKTVFSTEETKPVFEQVRARLQEVVSETPTDDGQESYTPEQIKIIIKSAKKTIDAPPKLIFQSIRVIMTGALRGPELDVLLPLVSRQVILSRLSRVLV